MVENYIIHPELEGGSFTFQGGKIGFLLLHGYTATTAEVRPLGELLHRNGFSVSAPLLPGHGTHPDDRNRTCWQDWLRSVEEAYASLSRQCDQVWVAGESMGGLLSLLLAARHPEIQGLLLYAPALQVRKLWGAYLLQYVKKHLPKRSKTNELLWKGYNVYPLRGAAEMLRLQKVVRRELGSIRQPTLAIFSEKDATVPTSASKLLKDRLGTRDLEVVILKNSPHVILLANEQQKVHDLTLNFLSKRLDGLSREDRAHTGFPIAWGAGN